MRQLLLAAGAAPVYNNERERDTNTRATGINSEIDLKTFKFSHHTGCRHREQHGTGPDQSQRVATTGTVCACMQHWLFQGHCETNAPARNNMADSSMPRERVVPCGKLETITSARRVGLLRDGPLFSYILRHVRQNHHHQCLYTAAAASSHHHYHRQS
ncbi:hypothetical protein CBL_00223 [Carabus blaptoides fortunei]